MVAVRHKGRTLTFTDDDKQESWATWHDDTDINQAQAEKLGINIAQHRAKLIRRTVREYLGHLPSSKKGEKYLRLVEQVDPVNCVLVFWRKTMIAVYTMPTTRIENKRYIATWHFKRTVKPKSQ